MAGGRISVFLADDSVIVREGVRAMLGLEPDLEIVGTASAPAHWRLPCSDRRSGSSTHWWATP
ncbi:MAG: hypothetical protein ACRDY6_19455 [Acidimicrobiia bacterium]